MMIRSLCQADAEAAAGLWLEVNLAAHSFLPADYWRSHVSAVRAQLLEAEVYVYGPEGQVQGLIGLEGDYIAGLFVRPRGQGIGTQLLDWVKALRDRLTLRVYQNNPRAVRFYQREGFQIQAACLDLPTGEQEYQMEWRRPSAGLPRLPR